LYCIIPYSKGRSEASVLQGDGSEKEQRLLCTWSRNAESRSLYQPVITCFENVESRNHNYLVLISLCLVHATSAAVADLEEDGEFVGRLVQTETCDGEAATFR
jgi:hypothetical protein